MTAARRIYLRHIDDPAGMGRDTADVDDVGACAPPLHALHRGPLIPRDAGLEDDPGSGYDPITEQAVGREADGRGAAGLVHAASFLGARAHRASQGAFSR